MIMRRNPDQWQSPTIEDALAASENRVRAQKEAQRQAELKQIDGLIDKHYASSATRPVRPQMNFSRWIKSL